MVGLVTSGRGVKLRKAMAQKEADECCTRWGSNQRGSFVHSRGTLEVNRQRIGGGLSLSARQLQSATPGGGLGASGSGHLDTSAVINPINAEDGRPVFLCVCYMMDGWSRGRFSLLVFYSSSSSTSKPHVRHCFTGMPVSGLSSGRPNS